MRSAVHKQAIIVRQNVKMLLSLFDSGLTGLSLLDTIARDTLAILYDIHKLEYKGLNGILIYIVRPF